MSPLGSSRCYFGFAICPEVDESKVPVVAVAVVDVVSVAAKRRRRRNFRGCPHNSSRFSKYACFPSVKIHSVSVSDFLCFAIHQTRNRISMSRRLWALQSLTANIPARPPPAAISFTLARTRRIATRARLDAKRK